MSRKIEVCLSPGQYHLYPYAKDSTVVVIDVLRATSAMCAAFYSGVNSIRPVATLQEAQAFKEKGYLVGAERDGMVVEGFDFGNSPKYLYNKSFEGKDIVITTTNGTQAIEICKNARSVVIGSFLNFSVLCEHLTQIEGDVLLLCSGWKDRFNLEDSLFAGAVAERLLLSDGWKSQDDAILSTRYLYNLAKNDPFRFLKNSSHGKRLSDLGLKEDIRFCLALDKCPVLPKLNGDILIHTHEEKTIKI